MYVVVRLQKGQTQNNSKEKLNEVNKKTKEQRNENIL